MPVASNRYGQAPWPQATSHVTAERKQDEAQANIVSDWHG